MPMILSLVPALFLTMVLPLALALVLKVALSLDSTLVLALPLALTLALVLTLPLDKTLVLPQVLVLPLELVQALPQALSPGPALLKGSETLGQISVLIIPPGINTATGSLRNNQLGNLCKSQNLVPEGYGKPQKVKGSLSFSMKQCQGASASCTTGRKRY